MAKYCAVVVNKEKCIGCINCMKRCPTKAIRIREDKAHIDEVRCVNCGQCIRVCKNKAISSRHDSFDIINGFKYKVALVTPTLFGQFGLTTDPRLILNAMMNIGFDDTFEVARGRDILSQVSSKAENLAVPFISGGCPACNDLIKMSFHGLIDNISTYLTAGQISAKVAREDAIKKTGLKSHEIGIFLISPCPAHVSLIKSKNGGDMQVDGVLSVKDVVVRLIPIKPEDVTMTKELLASNEAMHCATSGGEATTMNMTRVIAVDGMDNVVSVLKELEDGKLPEVKLVELNACPAGCCGGAMNIKNPYVAQSRINRLRNEIMIDSINDTDVADKAEGFYKVDKPYEAEDVFKLDDDFAEAIKKMKQLQDVREQLLDFDCGICGAPTCRDFAEDVVLGKAKIELCVRYSRKKKEIRQR